MHAIPVLLAILVGLLFGLLAWGFLRAQSHEAGEALMGVRDDVLTGLLVLAAFALGVFLTYMVIAIG
jgi:membrane protease YdiL (CAAX protease family)